MIGKATRPGTTRGLRRQQWLQALVVFPAAAVMGFAGNLAVRAALAENPSVASPAVPAPADDASPARHEGKEPAPPANERRESDRIA